MKFEKILPALREGKKITNRIIKLRGYKYIYYKDGTIFEDKGGYWHLANSEIVEQDNWEIVKEKKKIKLRDLTEKLRAIEKYCLGNVEYVGLAFDEKERVIKKRRSNKVFPLVEWQMSEKDCLEYCYKKGYTWNENGVELYEVLDRVSCWCCANKNLKELKNYYQFLPEYWKGLKDLQDRIDRPFKSNKTIYDLEKQFLGEKQ